MSYSDELCNKAENVLPDNRLSKVSGGDGETAQPDVRHYDNYCSRYQSRIGGGGGPYLKFYYATIGKACQNCDFFSTDPNERHKLDPDYDGIGYCFHDVE